MLETLNSQGAGPWPQTRIRFARDEDMPTLMYLCERLAEENAIGRPKMNMVRSKMERCVAREGGFIGVIGDEGNIEGAMCLEFSHMWYSDDIWWIQDVFHFVLPEYRASSNASDLIEWSLWWKEKLQIPLMLGIVSNGRTRAKLRFYERKLGDLSGGYFLVGAKTGLSEKEV